MPDAIATGAPHNPPPPPARGPLIVALLMLSALGAVAYWAITRGSPATLPDIAPERRSQPDATSDMPMSAAGWLRRAEDQRRAGNYLGAEQSLLQALRLRPDDHAAAEWLAQVRWVIAHAPPDAPLDGSAAEAPQSREELVRRTLLANARALLDDAERQLRAGRPEQAARLKTLIAADLETLGWPADLTARFQRLPDP